MEEKMKEIVAGREQYLQSDIIQLKNSMAQTDKEVEQLRGRLEQKDKEMEILMDWTGLREKELDHVQNEIRQQKKELEEQRNELNKQKNELEVQKTEWKFELERQKEELEDQRMELRRLNQRQEKQEWKHNRKETKNKHKTGLAPLKTTDFEKLLHVLQQEASLSATDIITVPAEEGNKQRIRSDDPGLGALEPVVSQLTQKVEDISAQLQTVKNVNTAQDAAITAQQQATGSAYVRWGNAACPNSSSTVYSGYIGGPWYDHSGGGANYLCLPPNPVFDGHPVPRYGSTGLYGTEYDTCDEPECDMSALCSVCHIFRASSIMVAGTNTCQPGWNLEYSGYLMANYPNYHGSTGYVCVDKARGYIPATKGNENGALLIYTTVHCGSLSCPPYVEGNVVQCVVCSR